MRVGVHCNLETCNDTKLWALDFLECDAHELLSAKKAERAKLSKTLESRGQGLTLLASHDNSFDEGTMTDIMELMADFNAEALVLKSTAAADPTAWVAAWKAVTDARPLFVDTGETQNIVEGCPPALDPLHCEDPALSNYWRVHGWHPERWVRLYGDKGLKELAKLTLLYYPDWVVLAHSGRIEEAADFKGRLI